MVGRADEWQVQFPESRSNLEINCQYTKLEAAYGVSAEGKYAIGGGLLRKHISH